jgi:hypothetical protein
MIDTDLLSPDDFWDDIYGPTQVGENLTREETLLSYDVPIVISYELIDLNITDYHFFQVFLPKETQEYFRIMKELSCCSINHMISESEHDLHFYRSKVTKRITNLLKQLDPDCTPDQESTFIFHFALGTDENGASRELGRRSPRVYFMLGRNGRIFPLFFDPFHEINPLNP